MRFIKLYYCYFWELIHRNLYDHWYLLPKKDKRFKDVWFQKWLYDKFFFQPCRTNLLYYKTLFNRAISQKRLPVKYYHLHLIFKKRNYTRYSYAGKTF